LEEACGDDGNFRRRLDDLLSAAVTSDSMLDLPATELVGSAHNRTSTALDTQIGNYRLLERIGEGGMGVVYLAEQTEPVRRRVALKLIKPDTASQRVIARFEAERQALALMDRISWWQSTTTTQSRR
jgi:serine/threonine protein kinase